MENATKALLIAGSVLIAILLIAMGIRIFNSTKGTTEATQTTMNATEVSTFNNKFMQYIGYNKSRQDIISLANVIISNNATSSHKVKFGAFGVPDGPYENASDISNYVNSSFFRSLGNKFYVTYEIENNGIINKLKINKAN